MSARDPDGLPELASPQRTWPRWVAAGIWLVYLGSPLGRIIDSSSPWRRPVGLVSLIAFVVVYLLAIRYGRAMRDPAHPGRELSERWAVIAVLLLCTGGVVVGAGDAALTCMVFVAATVVGILPARQALVSWVLVLAATELSARLVPGWHDNGNGFAVVLAGAAVWAFRVAFIRQQALVAAERQLSEAALAEERSRIARDLHDILGHSLTVVTVKAELAQRMLDVDPERARQELADLERLTRDALADVRHTALGVRGISLPAEIASARTALDSAGIEADLPTVADEVPTRWRELFAWAVREGVTNVIRHSGAVTCWVDLDADCVQVADDGAGCADENGDGQGLEGLRQRADLVGARVTTGAGPDGRGFCLSVQVPA